MGEPLHFEDFLSSLGSELHAQHDRLKRASLVVGTALSASRRSLERLQELTSLDVEAAILPSSLSEALSPAQPRVPESALKVPPPETLAPQLARPAGGEWCTQQKVPVCPPAMPVLLIKPEGGSLPPPDISSSGADDDSENACTVTWDKEVEDSEKRQLKQQRSLDISFDLKTSSPSEPDILKMQLMQQRNGEDQEDSRPTSPRNAAPLKPLTLPRGRQELLGTSNSSGILDPFKYRQSFSSASSDAEGQHGPVDRRNAMIRLRARLGKQTFKGNVSAQQIHNCLTALGLIRFSKADVEQWVHQIKMLAASVTNPQTPQEMVKRSSWAFWATNSSSVPGGPSSPRKRRVSVRGAHEEYYHIEIKLLTDVLLNEALLGCLEPEYQQMSLTIREVLFSGDANRLVAELTHVRVDDVAAPPEKPDLITKIEPALALVIVLNGVYIGAQTSFRDDLENVNWFWGNLAFSTLFLCEIAVRVATTGLASYLLGPEHWWNIFDTLLICVSIIDTILDAASYSVNLTPISILRVMRLIRLTRLLRIFRLRYMRELNLMVRGLLGGLQTLFWAVLLLFFTLYVIAVMATTTIGSSDMVPEITEDELFTTVPLSILTSFRCFMGDCTTSAGKPIIQILAKSHGFAFVLFYMASMIFVVFGLFNLIVAVYIENTMHAAKTDGEKNQAERHRESVKVARLTRQLLKKFCAAQKLFASEDARPSEVRHALRSAVFQDVGEVHTPISKEMFLCVIQDPSVQKIMDDLNIPPERASLFDVLDADSSGGLEVAELITGLLQVRGEAKKCDVIGALLAVRAVQTMLRSQENRLLCMETRLDRLALHKGDLTFWERQRFRRSRAVSKLDRPLKWERDVTWEREVTNEEEASQTSTSQKRENSAVGIGI